MKKSFFNQDAVKLAKALLGKVLCVRYQHLWLCAQIITGIYQANKLNQTLHDLDENNNIATLNFD